MPAQMPKAVAEAITSVMSKVDYVQKKGENKFHNYKFAAVGDILAKLQPAMAEAGLNVIQNELDHRLTCEGNMMEAMYSFTLSHSSGVTWDEQPCHTGMASARNTKGGFDDKALNKCHTAARKYFLLSLFQVPTGEMADPDEQEDRPDHNAQHHPPARPAMTANKPVPDQGDNLGDWPAWVEQFKQASLSASDRRQHWESESAALKGLRADAPRLYADLHEWAAAQSGKDE